MRAPLIAALVGLAGCCTDELGQKLNGSEAHDAELDAAQHRREQAVLQMQWHELCAEGRARPRTYNQEIACGDYYLRFESDKLPVVGFYRAAMGKATVRPQLCGAVNRILAVSMQPEQDLAGLSPTMLEECIADGQRQEQAAQLATTQRSADAARVSACQQQCFAQYSSCQQTVIATNAADFGAGGWGCVASRKKCNELCR